jgi:tetratricopeptide (TPR) repeat protein
MGITVISGTAGVGKTALAVKFAHQACEVFPDGQLYVNLRGYDADQPMHTGEALAAFLRALGMPGPAVPSDVGERAAAYRSLLAGRRMLLVLDNARDANQVRALLPGSATCLVIVTSRNALAGLVARDGARRLSLDLLPLDDAERLLRELIGERARADPDATTRLATVCCRLPLALRVAAERAAARPGTGLAALADELAASQRRLELLDADGDGQTALRDVLSWSYRHLDAGTARMFCLLGLHPGQDFDDGAAAALAAAPAEAGGQLGSLARAGLIQPAAVPGRYGMHDLLRGYARELLDAGYGEELQQAALTRLFDHYMRTVAGATRTLFPARFQWRQCAPPDPSAVPFTDPATARAWLDAETGNLPLVITYMARHRRRSDAARLADAAFPYLECSGRIIEATTACDHALRVARDTGDRAAEATALGNLGYACLMRGDYQQAARHLGRAVTLSRQATATAAEAMALGNLGVVHRRLGRYPQSAACQLRALALCRQLGDHWGEALALVRLAGAERRQGDLGEARERLRHAARIYRRLGDWGGLAQALTHLGAVECRQGRHLQATRLHQRAAALFRRDDDRGGEADARNGLGEAMLALGHHEQARACHNEALSLAQQAGDLDQQARADHGLGHACLALGEAGEGRDHLRAALSRYAALGGPEAGDIRAELSGQFQGHDSLQGVGGMNSSLNPDVPTVICTPSPSAPALPNIAPTSAAIAPEMMPATAPHGAPTIVPVQAEAIAPATAEAIPPPIRIFCTALGEK